MYRRRKWLNRFDQIVQEHLGEGDLNNEEIAARFDISERHLSRQVKNITGLSPQKYIRQYRLDIALSYLKNGTYRTVKETAEAIGYANISYFINQFEKQYGKKPLSVLRDEGWR